MNGLPLAVLLQDGGDGGAIIGGIAGLCGAVIGLAIAAVFIYGTWKAFEKAGEDGWKAIIPIYNLWVMAEVAQAPGWWGLLMLISPLNLVFGFLIGRDAAKAFGKGDQETMYGILGALFSPALVYTIFGFGDAEYTAGSSPMAV